MPRHTTLAQFEFFVLAAVARLGQAASAAAIRRSVEAATERSASLGAVYAAVSRLEDKGYLAHTTVLPTPSRGGRRRKLFRLTAEGEAELRHTVRVVRRMIDPLGSADPEPTPR